MKRAIIGGVFALILAIGVGACQDEAAKESPEKGESAEVQDPSAEAIVEEEPPPEPEKKKEKDDPYLKFDFNDPGDRMRARSRALDDMKAKHEEEIEFLEGIDKQKKVDDDYDKRMEDWANKK